MASIQQETVQKKNIKDKLIDLYWPFYSWVYMLLGKGRPVRRQDLSGLPKKNAEEDRIVEDIKMAKELIGKLSNKISKKTQPEVSAIKNATSEYSKKAVDVVDKPFLNKTFKIFIVLLAVIILAFVSKRLFTQKTAEKEKLAGNGQNQPAPTSYEYIPTNPSVYANDKIVLGIEESIKVLLNEILNKKLIEDSLKPPVLDMKIGFKE